MFLNRLHSASYDVRQEGAAEKMFLTLQKDMIGGHFNET